MQVVSGKIRASRNSVISTVPTLTNKPVMEVYMADQSLPTNFRTINLSQGKVAIVDAEDYERVSQFKWSALKIVRKGRILLWYAHRTIWHGKWPHGKQEKVFLHRFILDAPKGVTVDHKNRDGLDCRRDNMRLATQAQNIWNRQLRMNPTGFRGVSRVARSQTFRARITCHGRDYFRHGFKTAVAAAKAYDAMAREFHGEFAVLNFPDEGKV